MVRSRQGRAGRGGPGPRVARRSVSRPGVRATAAGLRSRRWPRRAQPRGLPRARGRAAGAWLGLALVLAAAALLRFWALSRAPINPFYDAAVRSMGLSWHNFFFGALEPGGRISVDKPPIDLWLQVAATKLLGFNTTALLLPEALGGTVATGLLFVTIRPVFGLPAAVLAGLALAVLPISVVTSRSDTMDSVMMAVLVAALWASVRALRTGHVRWVLLAGGLVGFAFDVKLSQALVPLPALGLMWLAVVGGRRRFAAVLGAAAALVAVGMSWIVVASLTPAAHRPYPIGSRSGSIYQAVFVYNGIERLNGTSAQVAPIGSSSPTGPTRLLASGRPFYGNRVGLELAAALAVGLAGALAALARRRAARRRRAAEASIAALERDLPDVGPPPSRRPPGPADSPGSGPAPPGPAGSPEPGPAPPGPADSPDGPEPGPAVGPEPEPRRRPSGPAIDPAPPDEELTLRRGSSAESASAPGEAHVQRWLAIGVLAWLVAAGALFSVVRDLQPRYIESLSPALAAAIGIGGGTLVRRARDRTAALLLALALAATVGFAATVGGVPADAVTTSLVAGGLALVLLLLSSSKAAGAARPPGRVLAGSRGRRALAAPLGPAAATALLAAPAGVAIDLVDANATAAGVMGSGVEFAAYLHAHRHGAYYEVASSSVFPVTTLIVRDAQPVLVLNDFHGPLVSLQRLMQLVELRAVRHVIITHACHTGIHCPATTRWSLDHAREVVRGGLYEYVLPLSRPPGRSRPARP